MFARHHVEKVKYIIFFVIVHICAALTKSTYLWSLENSAKNLRLLLISSGDPDLSQLYHPIK